MLQVEEAFNLIGCAIEEERLEQVVVMLRKICGCLEGCGEAIDDSDLFAGRMGKPTWLEEAKTGPTLIKNSKGAVGQNLDGIQRSRQVSVGSVQPGDDGDGFRSDLELFWLFGGRKKVVDACCR